MVSRRSGVDQDCLCKSVCASLMRFRILPCLIDCLEENQAIGKQNINTLHNAPSAGQLVPQYIDKCILRHGCRIQIKELNVTRCGV